MTVLTASLPGLASTLGAPMYALPVDIFRILAGFVGLEYFRRAYASTSDFSSPDGLIDHRVSQRLFPPTRLSLFQPGVPVAVFRWVFLLACIASTLVIVGYQTRAAGTALHAILKLDIARAPEFWRLRHLGMLRLCNYWALIVEPLLALMFVLPFNSVAKWSVVVSAAAFHIGIIATLKIPFANLSMLAALPIVLSPEIMELALQQPRLPGGGSPTELSPTDIAAMALVTSLILMVAWEVIRAGRLSKLPLWKTHMSGFLGNPMYLALWCVGIVQSYRLFDWIDTRNHHARYEVFRSPEGDPHSRREIDPGSFFPTSLRHLLLQSYLFGNVWLQIDAKPLEKLRMSILARHAQRYARLDGGAGSIEVFSVHQRVTADNLDLCRGERKLLMRFAFRDGNATLSAPTE